MYVRAKKKLVIGFATAGRPETYQKCLNGLQRNVNREFEIVVVDNTPDLNSNVDTSDVNKVIEPSEMIGPGESRQRIIEATKSEQLLFIDDDTIPNEGTVQKLTNTLETGSVKMASGIFYKGDNPEKGRNLGRILQNIRRDGQKILLDISIPLSTIIESEVTTWDVDVGTPLILIEREIFGLASFDPQYDFFFEWIDFFHQTWTENESVRARSDAKFEHLDGEYTGDTIRTSQSRKTDQEKFCNKWEVKLDQEIHMEYPFRRKDRTLSKRIAKLYVNRGIGGIADGVLQKLFALLDRS